MGQPVAKQRICLLKCSLVLEDLAEVAKNFWKGRLALGHQPQQRFSLLMESAGKQGDDLGGINLALARRPRFALLDGSRYSLSLPGP